MKNRALFGTIVFFICFTIWIFVIAGTNYFDNITINSTTKTNTINETTVDSGVEIETVVVKDGLVDGVDVSTLAGLSGGADSIIAEINNNGTSTLDTERLENSANWNAAYDHISATGASHTYIDQSVVSGSTPTFTGTNFTGIPWAGVSKTGSSFADLDTTSASDISSGTLAVTYGGTGQTTYTNGQLLIGNTTGNTLAKATLTEGEGIDVTNGTGTITLSGEDASTTNKGICEFATVAETNTGTDTTRAVTPDALAEFAGSTYITKLGTIATGSVPWANVSKTGSLLSDLDTALAGTLTGNLNAAQLPLNGSWTLNSNLNINSNNLYIAQSTGRVGIGVVPTKLLQVSSGSSGGTAANEADEIFVENSGDAGMTILGGASSTCTINFGDSDSNNVCRWQYNNTTDALTITSNDSPRMYIGSAGKVGIGTTNPNFNLSIRSYSAGSSCYQQMLNNDCGTTATDGFLIGIASDEKVYIAQNEAEDMIFRTSGANKAKFDSSGRFLLHNQAEVTMNGEFAQSNGYLATTKVAQFSRVILRGQTSGDGSTEIFLDESAAVCTIPTDTTYGFVATITGRQTNGSGESAFYVTNGVIKNVSGAVTLTGAVQEDTVIEDVADWSTTLDATGTRLRVRVDGAASDNVNWCAVIEFTIVEQ